MNAPRDIANPLERITWRDGQLLSASDLRDDQLRQARLRWLHAHYLHRTWGVVEGLNVTNPSTTSVAVSSGYALDIEGRELLLSAAMTLNVPADIVTTTTLYLVISNGDCRASCQPDLYLLCFGINAGKDLVQGELSWKTVKQVRPGYDVLLARVLIQSGMLAGTVDVSMQRRASTLARPKLWSDTTQQNQTGWIDGAFKSPLEIHATVDTANAGFTRTPLYFAYVSGAHVSVHGFIASQTASSFNFVVRPDSKTSAAIAEKAGWIISWLAIDRATT
jgi:hypothetical protein